MGFFVSKIPDTFSSSEMVIVLIIIIWNLFFVISFESGATFSEIRQSINRATILHGNYHKYFYLYRKMRRLM